VANINAPKIEYFASFADEIASKFRRLQVLVGHPTTSGDYHEEVIRTVLRTFLAKRFSVKKGFIYAGPENVSKQLDVLIVDETVPAAYIFQEGDFAIVTPQAAVAVMEIKSAIDASAFDGALQNMESAKATQDLPARLTGLVFGYDGPISNDLLDGWFRRPIPSGFQGHEVLAPDAMLFFKAETLLVRCNDQGRIGPDGRHYHRLTGSDDANVEVRGVAFQLSAVLAMLVNACEGAQMTTSGRFPGHGISLVQAERGGLSLERFSFGQGQSRIQVDE
jgi:hypothetical protein